MKVACVTCFLPMRENIGGPSGLLFQILKWRPPEVDVTVFIFHTGALDVYDVKEINELHTSGIEFVICPAARKPKMVPPYWPLGARKLSFFEMPDLSGYDIVWGYPYWFAPFLKSCGRPVLISGMDCATLLYWRKLKQAVYKNPIHFLRVAAGLVCNLLFEFVHLRSSLVHVVGQRDADVLKRLHVSSVYITHPFLEYKYIPVSKGVANNSLTILLSNPGDAIYGSKRYRRWVEETFDSLNNISSVKLIVHKGASDALLFIKAAADRHANFVMESIDWVEDYSAFLSNIDIQIFPLDVGAGTKTSVLTAIQHNVHAICTPVAAENVQENSRLYVVDDNVLTFKEGLIRAVRSVVNETDRGDALSTLAFHSPQECGMRFWKLLDIYV